MPRVNRRLFILGGVGAATTASLPRPAAGGPADPFSLGVASGDPNSDGVVLWTRLARSPLDDDGHGGMPNAPVPVQWQISEDESFRRPVASGTAWARYEDAHAVHVELGGLEADTAYYYRFRSQGHLSPVGRTSTAPARGKVGRELIMDFCSCAHYQTGYFTAYRRMAEDHPDLILHLGDYIYEVPEVRNDRTIRYHVGGETVTLADYRRRYAQYKTDPDLQAAHAAAAWIVIPDDHEVDNGYAGPIFDPARLAAAYRAYWENMPLRAAQKYKGEGIPLYRRLRWGSLATFHMLDTRQYRDHTVVCTDTECPGVDDPERSILDSGDTDPQLDWLEAGLGRQDGIWDIIGQQLFFAGKPLTPFAGARPDRWEGYRESRRRVQESFGPHAARNPIVLTGDMHKAYANDLKADYTDPDSATIGAELIATSVSADGWRYDQTELTPDSPPFLRYNVDRRGYVRTRISPREVRADFRFVDNVQVPDHPARTDRSFVIEAGNPGLQDL